jgi:hydroxymethylpyrimidine pyrophosphatase-like HAD family hydrolase
VYAVDRTILFLDLDGTLLNDQKEVTPGNRRAIGEALRRGRRIVVTSGRPLKSSMAQARRLGLAGDGCYVIAYNGAVIYDCREERAIFRQALNPEDLYRVYDEAARRVYTFRPMTGRTWSSSPAARRTTPGATAPLSGWTGGTSRMCGGI